MLAYFAEEAETIARMAHYLKDDIIYVREYAYGIDTDNYYDYYDNYKVNLAVTDWGGRGAGGGGSFPHCCHQQGFVADEDSSEEWKTWQVYCF